MAITGGGLTGGAGTGSTSDNTTTPFIPYKDATGEFSNSPFQYDTVNNKIISSATIEVPPGTLQVGEGLEISAAGVLQINRSILTGKTYLTQLSEFDSTGSQSPFWIDLEAEELFPVFTDFGSSMPLTGTFATTASTNEIINELIFRTTPGATIEGVRIEVVADSTGEPIFYFPSKSDYLAGIGQDLIADGSGFITLELREAPIALLANEALTNNYAIDSGDLLGNGTTEPYLDITRQVGTFYNIATAKTYAEESISTSLIFGGEIIYNSATTINILAGKGRIVSIDQPTGVVTVTPVEWEEQLNIPIPDIGIRKSTRIAVDINGGFVQVPFELTPDYVRDYIILGFIIHPDGEILEISNDALKQQNIFSQLIDGYEALGVIRKSGLDVVPYAGLSISKYAGILHSPGAGVGSGNAGQNIVEISPDLSGAIFSIVLQDGTLDEAATTVIKADSYDNNGVLTELPQPNDACIWYVYQSIEDVNGGLILAPGQNVYPDIQDAEINAETDTRIIPEAIEQRCNLIKRIIVKKSTTNLLLDAVFLPGAKFGVELTGGSSAAGSGGGDVGGPASSIDNELSVFDGATGKVIKGGSSITASNGILAIKKTNDAEISISSNNPSYTLRGASEVLQGTLDWNNTESSNLVLSRVGGGKLSISTTKTEITDATNINLVAPSVTVNGNPIKSNTVAARTTSFARISPSGVAQTINTGTFNYYRENGVAVAATFSNGVWTVPFTGVYQINARGLIFGSTSGFIKFWASKNNVDDTANLNDVILAFNYGDADLGLGGQMFLGAGDTIRIKYSVLGGSGWALDNFVWDASKISD